MAARIRHHVIYVPGLGDGYDAGRRLALSGWRIWGVRTEIVPMQWFDGRPFAEKEQRVLDAVARAERQGCRVSLIGESAGGSMAINVVSRLPRLHALVTVGGVNDPNSPISPRTLARSPAFDDSIRHLRQSLPRLDLAKTHVVRAWYDEIVHAKHTSIEGAHNHRLLSAGHLLTIALCLTVFSGYIVALIKRTR